MGGIALILSCSLKRIEETGRWEEKMALEKWKEKGEELVFIWRTGDLKCKFGGKDEQRTTGPVVTVAEDMSAKDGRAERGCECRGGRQGELKVGGNLNCEGKAEEEEEKLVQRSWA